MVVQLCEACQCVGRVLPGFADGLDKLLRRARGRFGEPLALLDLLERTAPVAVLGAVDDAVFWELLAQVVADPQARNSDSVFTEETRATLFGPLYHRLLALPVGAHLTLTGAADLRDTLPRIVGPTPAGLTPFSMRQVTIQRGATFSGAPSSLTAQRFADMTEEPPPWCLTLVF